MIEARIDLLFTMSENTCCKPHGSQTRIGSTSGRTFAEARRADAKHRRNGNVAEPTGGARRDRTDDLLLAKQALSQLSYGPSSRAARTSKLRSSEGWWAWEDLNFRPHAYQARALTN